MVHNNIKEVRDLFILLEKLDFDIWGNRQTTGLVAIFLLKRYNNKWGQDYGG